MFKKQEWSLVVDADKQHMILVRAARFNGEFISEQNMRN